MSIGRATAGIVALIAASLLPIRADEQLIDAERFADLGGWVIDQQSMDQMGSPYLMAHGLGEQVKNAQTRIQIRKGGEHRVWVRTRDWVGKWKGDQFDGPMRAVGSPGVFHLLFDQRPLGSLAEADYRIGRESMAQTREELAPSVEDNLVMGTSVQWNTRVEEQDSAFPETPWAIGFTDKTCVESTRGDWDWETGFRLNHVTQMKEIRDYALRVVFGNWSVLKNSNRPDWKKKFGKRKPSWIAYIGGKRESRRLMGDIVLRQQDITEARPYPDASVTTTWTIDLHYPQKPVCACDAFQSTAHHLKIKPYPIPYRCFYSRNVPNLMMAGRNISVTHIALGTVRVQRTTGMMGEVVGMANAVMKKHNCLPRDVYANHLDELKQLMTEGVPGAPKLR